VQSYQRRPLLDRYEVLVLDGVVLMRKTGLGEQKRPVLVARWLRDGLPSLHARPRRVPAQRHRG